eukprot:NODE_10291_length_1363_cov_3.090615.p1 GENE.NODE_10291_length_1363_cov_3.090615~~NODE_10291_length_1363_cov_3.090615.p1  ORF type:complete len:322 (+),score=93.86 NODE_10291_length_1363_cov_3.090615:256-1221(+)
MRTRQQNSQQQLQAEMSIIRNAINANNTDLADFRRHSATIQQQMQSEISEIRESLGNVFMEITAAVRNSAAADQDIKLKIQSLNEQAVRNDTAFLQLADAADQSQSKLRSAVEEMQLTSERMRDELTSLDRYAENLETTAGERCEKLAGDVDQLGQDLHLQLERRREQLKRLVNDVMTIGESLPGLVADLGEQKRGATEMQSRLQKSMFTIDAPGRPVGGRGGAASGGGGDRASGSPNMNTGSRSVGTSGTSGVSSGGGGMTPPPPPPPHREVTPPMRGQGTVPGVGLPLAGALAPPGMVPWTRPGAAAAHADGHPVGNFR